MTRFDSIFKLNLRLKSFKLKFRMNLVLHILSGVSAGWQRTDRQTNISLLRRTRLRRCPRLVAPDAAGATGGAEAERRGEGAAGGARCCRR